MAPVASAEANGFQRARILEAMVSVVHERGYAATTVTVVSARAKVGRRTFYEHFDDLQECFLAVLDDGDRRVRGLVSQAFELERSWLAGLRGALAELLSFFDAEPALAHVLLVESIAAGAWARDRRERSLASLTQLIEDRWGMPVDGHVHPLVNRGVIASLLGVLHSHLVAERPEPLTGLLGPLMGIVTAPYLDRPAVAREIERAESLARELLARRDNRQDCPSAADGPEIPDLLRNPRARRARACLLYLVEHPGASNREVARAASIANRTQASKLLARLAGMGLLTKRAASPGRPNSWSLTEHGMRVSAALAVGSSLPRRPGASTVNRG